MVETTFYAALVLCISGLCYQILRLVRENRILNTNKRHDSGVTIKLFFLNTLFQSRLFKAGKIRWAIHFLLLSGFLYLLIVHALYSVTADLLFDDYQPTLNPFQALRNLTGVFVLVGCLAFFIRRRLNLRVNSDRRLQKKGMVVITLILLIISTGFLLESTKIISEPIFMEMVEEFSDLDGTDELVDLKAYWKDHYSVVFQEELNVAAAQMENGGVLNDEYCLYCHSPIKSAALSNVIAKSISGIGVWLNAIRADKIIYWIHYSFCLTLLIILPFSRMSHLLFIPAASARNPLTADQILARGAYVHPLMLEACTNCGYCSEVCSVYPNYQIQGNPNLLPHFKIESVKDLIRQPSRMDMSQLIMGNDACTLCHNCTDICPSGIDLQSLWVTLDVNLTQRGIAKASTFFKQISLKEWRQKAFVKGPAGAEKKPDTILPVNSNLADQTDSFDGCIQCTVCTNVCPVVAHDSDLNDMSPHQIMNLLRMGEKHLATGTRMVWTCLTCYSCQENCPQQIRVTDILLELRNTGGAKAEIINKPQKSEKATGR